MFNDFEDFLDFMIFCHTYYELNDVWYYNNDEKGILFEGWFDNPTGNKSNSPSILDEFEKPNYKKRISLDEIYNIWIKVSKTNQLKN